VRWVPKIMTAAPSCRSSLRPPSPRRVVARRRNRRKRKRRKKRRRRRRRKRTKTTKTVKTPESRSRSRAGSRTRGRRLLQDRDRRGSTRRTEMSYALSTHTMERRRRKRRTRRLPLRHRSVPALNRPHTPILLPERKPARTPYFSGASQG